MIESILTELVMGVATDSPTHLHSNGYSESIN